MHLQERTLFEFDLGHERSHKIHHVTNAPAKIKVAMSNGLEQYAFTRKNNNILHRPKGKGHTKCKPVPSTSRGLRICKA